MSEEVTIDAFDVIYHLGEQLLEAFLHGYDQGDRNKVAGMILSGEIPAHNLSCALVVALDQITNTTHKKP